MYNRIYESLFEGSMVGAGALTFAVWSYVLGKMKPSRKDNQFYVEINPVLLGAILGEKVEDVAVVLASMCAPDEQSRTKDEKGARLVREGQFLYRVVNGSRYNDLRSHEERREYQKLKQAEYRKRRKFVKREAQIEGGTAAVADGLAEANGDTSPIDRI
jgi:hypothetical protein